MKKKIINYLGYNKYFSKQAQELYYWSEEEKNITKKSKIFIIALKIEYIYRQNHKE